MKRTHQHISVIGDGGWGTTLAIHLCKQGHSVTLWGPFPDYVKEMERTRINRQFLPDFKLPRSLKLSSNLAQAINSANILVFAVPSNYAARVLEQIKETKTDLRSKILLSVTKGIDTASLLRMSQLVHHTLGNIKFAALSGPNISTEVARGVPSTAVIACHDQKTAQLLQHIFNSPTFRIYTNNDIIGVELGGSLKNIIAIACGVCDGLGYGSNTKAALLTRGLAEMARLGSALGAKADTFSGLSGLGDLVTTSFNPGSRNRTVGEQLGKGKKRKQILSSMKMVAEGVETVKAAYALSRRHKIPMPITSEIYKILYQNKSPSKAVADLMSRKTKSE